MMPAVVRYRGVRLVLLLILLILPRPTAHAQVTPLPGPRFGLVNAYVAPDAAAELGIGWEQITFDWRAFQPHSPDDFITDSIRRGWTQLRMPTERSSA
jgi:hypothetical protein